MQASASLECDKLQAFSCTSICRIASSLQISRSYQSSWRCKQNVACNDPVARPRARRLLGKTYMSSTAAVMARLWSDVRIRNLPCGYTRMCKTPEGHVEAGTRRSRNEEGKVKYQL
jgi:hypothetical protein